MSARRTTIGAALAGWGTGLAVWLAVCSLWPRGALNTASLAPGVASAFPTTSQPDSGPAVVEPLLPTVGVQRTPVSDTPSADPRPEQESWFVMEAEHIAATYAGINPGVREAYLRHGVAAALLRVGAPYQVRPLAMAAGEFDRWRAEVRGGPVPVERAQSLLERHHRLTDRFPTRLRDAPLRVVAYACNDGLEVVLGRGTRLAPEWTAEVVVEYGVDSPLRLIDRALSAEDRARSLERCQVVEAQARNLRDEIWRLTIAEAHARLQSNLAERDVMAVSVADEKHGGVRVFRRGMDAELDAAIAELEELTTWTRQRVESLLRG